jgi:hypothetical protein
MKCLDKFLLINMNVEKIKIVEKSIIFFNKPDLYKIKLLLNCIIFL